MLKQIPRFFIQGEILWTLIFTFLRISGGLISLPIALSKIPSAEIGIYYTFMSLAGIATMLDFGMLGTIGRNASYAWAGVDTLRAHGIPENCDKKEPNLNLLKTLTHVTRIWYSILATCICILLLIGGGWFLYGRIIHEQMSPNLLGCWAAFAIVTSLSIGTSYWGVLLTGIGEVKKAAKFGTISQLLSIGILITSLLLGAKLWAYTISMMVSVCVLRLLCKKNYLTMIGGNLPSFFSRPEGQILSQIWPMAWRSGVTALGEFLTQRGNVLIVSCILGLEITAQYGLTVNLYVILFQIGGVFLYASNPRITQALVHKDHSLARKLFITRAYGGLLLSIMGAAIIIGFGNQILGLLGSHTSLMPPLFSLGIFIVMLLDRHQSQYSSLVIASNDNPFVLPTIASGVANLGLCTWLATKHGMPGVIIGHFISQAVFNHWWPVMKGIRVLKMR